VNSVKVRLVVPTFFNCTSRKTRVPLPASGVAAANVTFTVVESDTGFLTVGGFGVMVPSIEAEEIFTTLVSNRTTNVYATMLFPVKSPVVTAKFIVVPTCPTTFGRPTGICEKTRPEHTDRSETRAISLDGFITFSSTVLVNLR
jgi:hypothetical protein